MPNCLITFPQTRKIHQGSDISGIHPNAGQIAAECCRQRAAPIGWKATHEEDCIRP